MHWQHIVTFYSNIVNFFLQKIVLGSKIPTKMLLKRMRWEDYHLMGFCQRYVFLYVLCLLTLNFHGLLALICFFQF